jgi:hypothetical protein
LVFIPNLLGGGHKDKFGKDEKRQGKITAHYRGANQVRNRCVH